MNKKLESMQRGIDRVDNLIIKLLRKRSVLVAAADEFSLSQKVSMDKLNVFIQKVRQIAIKEGVDPDSIETVYLAIISSFTTNELCKQEKYNPFSNFINDIQKEFNLPSKP